MPLINRHTLYVALIFYILEARPVLVRSTVLVMAHLI
jgi:hypothetical protein